MDFLKSGEIHRMKHNVFRPLALLLFVVLISACSTTLGNRADLNSVTFTVGQTQKNEVARVLGLPSAILKDKEQNLELWAYQDQPTLTSILFATPVDTTTAMNFTWTPDAVEKDEFKSAAVVYAFDVDGTLKQLLDQRQ